MSIGIRYAHKGWDQTIDDIGVCETGSQVCGEVYNIANPGYGLGKTPIRGRPVRCPKFSTSTTASSSWCASATRTTGRPRRASCSAASMATTAAWRARTRTGRRSPNVSRYYDSLFLSFDQKGNEAIGRLNTDRPVQFKLAGHLHAAVGHQRRRELLRGERAAPVVDGDLPGRADLLQRPRRPRPHADAEPDRPAASPTTSKIHGQHPARRPGEHHQPVRPGHRYRHGVRAPTATRWSSRVSRRATSPTRSSSPAASTRWPSRRRACPGSGRPSPTYKLGERLPGRALDPRSGRGSPSESPAIS